MDIGASGMESCMVDFGLDIFKQIASNSPADNVFLSPSSIMVVMAMLHYGARGNTRDQMTRALKFDHFNGQSPYAHFDDIMNSMQRDNGTLELNAANRLFPSNAYSISPQYVQDVVRLFSAGVMPMDFLNFPEQSRVEINKWVESETKSTIKDLLAPGTITSNTFMVVANAIYFKGTWKTSFVKDRTSPGLFFTSETNNVAANMMTGRIHNAGLLYSNELASSILELPYDGNDVSMLVFLPTERTGLGAMESKLTLSAFQNVISSMRPTTVDVTLPKFQLKTEYNLNAILTALGISDLFDRSKANLSGIGSGPLYVSSVVHKAFVDVNEEGTVASAATAGVVVALMVQETPQFRADHPFLFVIYDKTQQVPLFIGRIATPTSA